MASHPINLQPPYMVLLEEKVFMADHYNIRAKVLGIDIDIFLEPLMQEKDTLWKHGVKMWDELAHSTFTCKAIIFVTHH
jgi:hypothetical protein